jgi:hypothetical protein
MTYSTFEDLEKTYKDSISDDFSDNNGFWNNYTNYDVEQADRLLLQKHTDIRSFYNLLTTPTSVYTLSKYKVGTSAVDAKYYLSNRHLNSNSTSIQSIASVNENWISSSTISNSKVLNGYYGIDLTCAANATTSAYSVLTSSVIDISNYATSDYIVATFPNYPSGSITGASSYLDLSSDATGAFDSNQTTSIPLNSTNVNQIGSTGHYELKCTLSSLSSGKCDLSKIAAVRFRIAIPSGVSSAPSFKCISIRCVSVNWRDSLIDIDTANNRIYKTIPNNFVAFPTTTLLNGNTVLVRSFGKLFTTDDPKILNGSIAANIELGDVSLSQTANNVTSSNEFAFYFNLGTQKTTQGNLGGPNATVNQTQGYLTAAGKNIELIDNVYVSIKQKDLSVIPTAAPNSNSQNQSNLNNYSNKNGRLQSDLNAKNQAELNQNLNLNKIDYLKISFNWYKNASSSPSDYQCVVKINDSLTNLYTFLIPNNNLQKSKIIFNPVLEDDYIQIFVYKYNEYDQPKLIYKTNKIFNTLLFSRSRGRIGWSAILKDADSYINFIQSRGLVYGEYKSNAAKSRTPVKGVKLFSDYSKDVELVTSLQGYNGAVISDDKEKYNNVISTKVYLSSNSFMKGLTTNQFYIEDIKDISINLNIWSLTNKLKFILINSRDQSIISLIPNYYKTGVWSNINVNFKSDSFVCGNYKFAIIYDNTIDEMQWWVNNLSIKKRLVSWETRSDSNSLINYDSENWINIKKTINNINDGVLFDQKGTNLQFRARAKSHYASIDTIKISPIYATLGNFVWRDES